MSRFWNTAVEVFENATSAQASGSPADVAVVIDRSGGLRLVMSEGWSPEGLQSHYGAAAVYHVTHTPEGVCVDGRGPAMSCTLRGPRSCGKPFRLPPSLPLYSVETRKLLE